MDDQAIPLTLDVLAKARDEMKKRGLLSTIPRSQWKTRYFIDTEFTDFNDSQLISVAIVGEDGCEFYGERSDFERPQCSDFVRDVVLPQLGQFPGRSMPLKAQRVARRVTGVAVGGTAQAQACALL